MTGGGHTPPTFVFGANEAGRHGKGAALFARLHRGAIYGQGEGLQGNAYGIPTKDRRIRTLPLDAIRAYVDRFIAFATSHPDMQFEVTRVGCGHAGYEDADIAPFFESAPSNCSLPEPWMALLGRTNPPVGESP